MKICKQCGMYMKPMPDGTCEFCGENPDKEKEKSNTASNQTKQ